MQCPEQSSSLARRAADSSRRGMSPLKLCRQKGVFPRVKKCAESADLWMKFHFCSWLTTCVNFCNGQMSVLCFVYLLQFMSSNVSYLWVWSAQRWEIKLRFCKKDTFFLRNHRLRFVLCSKCQIYSAVTTSTTIYGGDFLKFCGLLKIYELFNNELAKVVSDFFHKCHFSKT